MIILGDRLSRSSIPFYAFGLLLLTACPLLFPKSGEQQYSYVQGLCFLAFAWMALIFQMQKRKQAMVVRSMDMAIAVCLLALLLHIFWIRPVSLSVWRWVDTGGLFAFYVFVRQSSSKGIRILLTCVMVGGLLQCLYAGMQGMGLLPSLHNAFPMTGSFLNSAPLAGYLAVLTSMGMVELFCTDGFHGKLRIVAVIGLLLFGSFVFLLNSRAAWFALLVVAVGILYDRLKMKRKRVYAVCIVIALALSLYGMYRMREVSADGRLFIWKNTCEMIKDHPLLGVGIDRFKAEFPAYQAQYHSQLTQEVEKYYDGNTFLVFNEYLRALAETGCLLPLLALLPLGTVWRYKDVSMETRMAAGGLGCLLVFGFFSYPFSILTLKVLAVLFLGIIGRESRVVCSWNVSNSLQSVVGGTAVVCVAFSFYGLTVVSKISSYAHTDEKYACWFRDNVSFVRHYCQETLERGDTVQAIQILSDAIGRIPVAGFYQHRAELYAETGDYLHAEADYKFLRNLSPTFLEPVLKLARLYRDTGRVKEAIEVLKPYLKVSPKGKTLEQKAVLLEMRELYQAMLLKKP